MATVAGAQIPATAQSGRNRSRPPAAEPPPQPEPAAPQPTTATPQPARPAATAPPPVPASAVVVAQGQSGPTTRYVLKNGLVVLVRESAAVPLAAIVTSVRAGSAGEPLPRVAALAASAAAHGPRPGDSIDARVRALGTRLEVEVDRDAALFESVVDAASFSDAIAAHAAILERPQFDGRGVDALDASRRAANALDGAMAQAIDLASGAAPANDLPVAAGSAAPGGSEPAAPGATRPAPQPVAATPNDAVASFYAARYRLDRTTVVVTGAVDAYTVVTTVQRAFVGESAEGANETPAAPSPASARQATRRGARAPVAGAPEASATIAAPRLPALAGGLVYERGRSGDEWAGVAVAFDTVDAGVAETAVLAAALAEGRASRLGLALRAPALATGIESAFGEPAIALRLATDPSRLDAVETVLFREIDKLRHERLSDAELQRARNMAERRLRVELETVEGTALALARIERRDPDAKAVGRLVERIRATTADDLQRAASRYLVASKAAVVELLPAALARNHTSSSFAALVASWAPGLAREVDPKEVRQAEAAPAVGEGRERGPSESADAVVLAAPRQVRDFSTLDGPRAFVREDQSRPLVAIGFFFAGGRVLESLGESGITELALRSMLRGSKAAPGARFLSALEQIGGEARVVNEPDLFGIVVEVLSRNADRAVEIAVGAINEPVLDEADVKLEREALLLDQRVAQADGPSYAEALAWKARYPQHAYGQPALGNSATVSKLDRAAVRAWFDKDVATRFPLVGIVGDTDGSSLVSRHVVDEFEREEGEPGSAEPLPNVTSPAEAIDATNGAATSQAVGFLGPGGGNDAGDALEVATAAARDRIASALGRAAAGSVRGRFERRRYAGMALFAATTAPRDETRARDAIFGEAAKVGAASLSSAELERARAAAAIDYERDVERLVVRLVEYVRTAAFRVALETVDTHADRMKAVAPEAVKQVASVLFGPTLSARGVARGGER